MKEFKLNLGSLSYFIQEITKLLQSSNKDYRVSIKQWKETRSLPQNALQHMIYTDISKFLISKGRADWDKDYTKMCLKSKFLGWEVKEIIDISTGEVTTKEMLRHSSDLDTGEAYHYTTQLIAWADSIGCPVRVPNDCEYMKLRQEQER